MLSNYRRRGRAGAVTPYSGLRRGSAAVRATKTLYNAAKKLAPYARAAGAKTTLGRKMGQGFVKPRGGTRRIAYRSTANSDNAAVGNELTHFKRSVGRYPKIKDHNLFKIMKAGMNDIILRAQGITNFDTNVGYFPLANRLDATLPIMPIHVWDLSTFPNADATGNVAGKAFYWSDATAAANVATVSLNCQTAAGSGTVGTPGTIYYEKETTAGELALGATGSSVSRILHDWTQVKLNLYAARKRGTTYFIDFVQIKNEFANPLVASGTNREMKDLFRYWQSNLIYSNLQSYRKPSGIKIVKSFKFYIPGGSADDLDTIGKIKEVKLFLKHGNVHNLSWQTGEGHGTVDDLPHAQADGADFTNASKYTNFPRHNDRLMMVIRAFSPERRAASWTVDSDPLTEPSYDMIIRNKWSVPS